MRFHQRLLLLLYAILACVVSAYVIFYASGWTRPIDSFLNYASAGTSARWVAGVTGAVVLLVSLYVLVKLFNPGTEAAVSRHLLVKEGDLGQTNVSLGALETVVVKAAKQVEGIREVKPDVRKTPEGVAILLRVGVAPTVSVPKLSADLQETVQDKVRSFSGVEAVEIRLAVENVSAESGKF